MLSRPSSRSFRTPTQRVQARLLPAGEKHTLRVTLFSTQIALQESPNSRRTRKLLILSHSDYTGELHCNIACRPPGWYCHDVLLSHNARSKGASGEDDSVKVQAYVFIDTENLGPKRIVAEVRKIPGVVRADALFGMPDIVAIVEGDDVATMDAVIDAIAEISGILDPESKVMRWV